MKIRKNFLIVIFILVNYLNGEAQNSPGLKLFTPPSPTASSLGKYGETPVSLYTGVPNINLPVYTLKGRDLELPISLSYNAGGIKIDEIASWVGIGWSLNAGGVITRSLRGMPDDALGGYFSSYVNVTTFAKKYLTALSPTTSYLMTGGNGQDGDQSSFDQIIGGYKESEPDIFYFNFGKYSGKFFMNENGQFVAAPLEALKIEYATGTANPYGLSRWIITTPDGVKYVFGNSLDGTKNAFENNSNASPTGTVTTAWYLVEIYSPNGDKISLNYSDVIYSYTIRSAEVLNQPISWTSGGGAVLPFRDIKWSVNNMRSPRLTSITSCNGTVTFGVGPNRTDLPGEAPLDNIKVYDDRDLVNPVKKWTFFTDYSTNRLTLDSVTEYSGDGSLKGQTNRFQYNGMLPDMNPNGLAINAQDLWGYYNGMTTNSVLPQGFQVSVPSYGQIAVTGADRHSDEGYMQMGSLARITYPTGGYTQFDYEANQYYTQGIDQTIPDPAVGKVAGFHFLYDQTETQDFTVTYPDPNTGVVVVACTLRAMNQGCPFDPYGYSQCYTATIKGINGTSFASVSLKEGTSTFTLSPGQYEITAQGASTPGQSLNNFYFFLDWSEYPPSQGQSPYVMVNKTIGGLRIKRITDFDGVNTKVKRYVYSRFGDTASSAVMVNMPANYASMYAGFTDPDCEIGYAESDILQVKSYPLIPLLPTQGSTVGYQNVTELDGENGENGKTEYTYTTANDYPDDIKTYRPYPPPTSFDWRRGKLLQKTVYKNISGTFIPVTKINNGYRMGATPSIGYGLVADIDYHVLDQCAIVIVPANAYFALGYQTVAEFTYLQSDTTTVYDQNDPSKYMQTINFYTYDTTQKHYQLTKTKTKNSKGQDVETDYAYPQDLTLTGYAETARQDLISKFILTPVLNQKNLVNGVQQTMTNNYYKTFGNGLTLPESIELQVASNPAEKRVEFLRYDAYGNMVQEHKINDAYTTYIWDYNNAFPIAAVNNADSADIAYTSFEADGKGNWTYTGTPGTDVSAPTGSKSYPVASGVSKTGLTSSTTYTVSMWCTGSPTVSGTVSSKSVWTLGSWTYKEFTISGVTSTTISGTGNIDELRLYPASAQMTSYTYSPVIGLTASSDPNGRLSFYQYDALNRLSAVKDQDGNIVKTIQYHYKSQPY
ncbi:MAG TPA: RHS repeat domain-containing protein [Puia sp.]|nr:RHS repeat domain-containing protein [Puia sp.]